MIFWIGLGIALVVALVLWIGAGEGVGTAIFCGIVSGAFAFLFGALILGSILGVRQTAVESVTPLKALATGSTVHGTFFLGSGSINGERTINYITNEGNRNYIKQQPADRSVVIEDTPIKNGPHLVALHQCSDNGWIMPWKFCQRMDDGAIAYEFHIPAGSVLSDYTVENK